MDAAAPQPLQARHLMFGLAVVANGIERAINQLPAEVWADLPEGTREALEMISGGAARMRRWR